MSNVLLLEQRCECGRLLLKGIFLQASLEIKCKKCGKINKIGQIKKTSDDCCYILVFNELGIITNADEAASRILGYSHDELIGMHFTEIDTDVSQDIATRLMPPQSILAEDHYIQLESFNKTKAGKKLAVSVFLQLYKPTENETCLLVSASVKNNLDYSLENKNQNKFMENACDFYFDIDKNGLARYISQSIESLFGISPQVALGRSYLDFVPEDKKEEAEKRFLYFSSREEPYRILDYVGLDLNGKTTYTDLFFTPNISQDGKFIGYRVLGWLKK